MRILRPVIALTLACGGAAPPVHAEPPPSRPSRNDEPRVTVRATDAPARCEELGFGARTGTRTEPVANAPRFISEGGSGFVEPATPLAVPPGITLAIDGVDVTSELVTVRAWLVNANATDTVVHFWDAGLGYFRLSPAGPGISQRPLAPIGPREIYPARSMVTVPANGRIAFVTSICLVCWEWPRGARATIAYALQTLGRELTGTVEATRP